SVTEDVTERTGYWQVDRKKILATVADTPGFADTDGRDAIFIPRIRNYIVSLSRRVGIDAFMMVFKINMGGKKVFAEEVDMNIWGLNVQYAHDQIIAILETFEKMMKLLRPSTYWQNVVLVFTGVDYAASNAAQMMNAKVFVTNELVPQIQKHFNLDHPLPAVFLSTATPICAYARGLGECDCVEANKYLVDVMRRLWRTVREKANTRPRWVWDETVEEPEEPQTEEEEAEAAAAATATTAAPVATAATAVPAPAAAMAVAAVAAAMESSASTITNGRPTRAPLGEAEWMSYRLPPEEERERKEREVQLQHRKTVLKSRADDVSWFGGIDCLSKMM
ncbi:hypothetical protein BC938DRAFT_476941, partial [Jimgerdemannia flammicorona]